MGGGSNRGRDRTALDEMVPCRSFERMQAARSAWFGVTGVLVAVTATACGDAAESEVVERVVDTYEVAVRAFVRDDPTPVTAVSSPGGSRPVVYVVGLDGVSIGPRIQADVVRRVVDDIDLRFADDRDEAFDRKGVVHDDGALIELGSIPDDEDRFEVEAVWQRSTDERRELTVRFEADGSDVTVTGTSVFD